VLRLLKLWGGPFLVGLAWAGVSFWLTGRAWPIGESLWLLVVVGSQFIGLVVIGPLLLLSTRSGLEALARVGGLADGFGVAMLVVLVKGMVGLVPAVAGYCFVAVAAMLQVAAWWTAFQWAGRPAKAVFPAAGVSLLLAAWYGWSARLGLSAWVKEDALLGRLDLAGAVLDAAGRGGASCPWYVTLACWAALAGVIWAVGIILQGDRREPGPER